MPAKLTSGPRLDMASLLPFITIKTIFLLVIAALIGRFVHSVRRQRQINQTVARKHGCQPIHCSLPYDWPLSLDVLKKQYDALPSKQLLALWTQYFDQLEPTFSVHLFGATGYATADPQNIEAINRTRFQDWGLGSRRDSCLPFLGDGIFAQDGKAWQRSRDLVSRQFHRTKYYELSTLREHVESFIERLGKVNNIVDLQPEFYIFTLTTTTALLFGESISTLGEQVTKDFCEHFDYASGIVAVRARLAEACWLYSPRRFKKACAAVKNYADHFVQKALHAQEELGREKAFDRYPFILDLYDELQDRVKVRDQLVNVLIAGRDSTADTLGWTFFQLVRHPEILKRLREEVERHVGIDPNFDNSTLKQMTYLKAVLNEVLRLYPQLPVNLRFATSTTVLPRGGGPDGQSPLLMPKGTGIASSIYHMHRRCDLYGADARSFRPERWLTGELDNIGSAYLPFHSGPRMCLGREFAMTQATYLIVRLLQVYPDIRLPEGTRIDPVGMERQNWSILVSSAEGCKVLLK